MKHQFVVEGMTCGGCASRIATSLEGDSRVSRAVVDYATRSALVEGELSLLDVKSLVEKSGYHILDELVSTAPVSAKSFWRDSQIQNLMFAGFLTLAVMSLAMGPMQGEYPYIEGFLATIFLLGPGRGFIVRAWKQLLHKSLTMDTLISLGMMSAWGLSWVMLGAGHEHLYFESAVMIGFFVLLGKTLEDLARRKSIGDVDRLIRLRPKKVWLIKSEEAVPVEVDLNTLKVGDKIYVRQGDMVAVDGRILEEASTFDESVVTGESLPRLRQPGETVPSGAVNASAVGVLIEVALVGKDSTVEQMIRMIEDASLRRPKIQALADRVSRVFVPFVLGISLLTFLGWYFLARETLEFSSLAALSVLVVACPCALGLATPVAWVAGLGRAARAGVLVRSYESLERLCDADTIVFDKTGTLTEGRPKVVAVKEETAMDFAAARAAFTLTSHPLARAAAQWIRDTYPDLAMPQAKLVSEVAGEGVTVELAGERKGTIIRFGRPSFISKNSLPESWGDLSSSNKPVVAVAINEKPVALFVLEDLVRFDASDGLKKLRDLGKIIVIASGDKENAVKAIAESAKEICSYHAELRPEGKRDLVTSLQKSGHVVAFVGDGINDAPALAAADVGLSMGSGTDVAAHSSGLVLQRSGIASVAEAIELSRRITRIIKQNFFWAFFYNVAAIPLAVAGKMSPMMAALAMALSSVSVVLNALRLRV